MADRIRQNHEGQHEGRDAGEDEEESVPEIDPQTARDEVLRRAARVNITTVNRWRGNWGSNIATDRPQDAFLVGHSRPFCNIVRVFEYP